MIWLIFAHFIADAGLQPDWMLNAKKHNWYVLWEHSMVWAGIISLVLAIYGRLDAWKILFLVIGHYLIDLWKIKNAKNILELKYLYVDQLLHLGQLLTVYYL